MTLMEYRHRTLEQTLAGYEQTGVPLVAIHGSGLSPAGFGDDPGIYYFVPALVRLSGLPLSQSVDLFLGGIVIGSLVLGVAGAFAAVRRWVGRLAAVIGLVYLARIAIGTGDVYVVPASVAMAVVPWCMYFRRRAGGERLLLVFGAVAGVAVGLAHVVRVHAGTAVVLFAGLVILLDPARRRGLKCAFALVLALGATLPLVHVNRAIAARDVYLAARVSEYRPAPPEHVLWHSVYIGLGFLENEHGIRYRDEVAMAKVAEVAPQAGYLSGEYEAVLRGEVLGLVRTHPLFVARTIAAKIWALGRYVLIFANVGLLAAVVYRKPWHIDLAFSAALAFSALFGILVIPALPYVLGLVAFSTLYGIVSIGEAAERNAWGRVKRLLPIGRR